VGTPDEVLAVARFNPKVRWYWLLSVTAFFVISVVGIPLIPIYWLIGLFITQRYLDRLTCVLTPRALRVTRGLLVREEKTIPLDKITDVGLVEGPIMRWLDLQALSIETAGQTGRAGGALVRLTGIEDARAFRDRVLEARDSVVYQREPSGAVGADVGAVGADVGARHRTDEGVATRDVVGVLREIHSTLERVERALIERDGSG